MLVQHHFDAARWELARPAGRTALRAAADAGAQPLDEGWLQARIAAPLSAFTNPHSKLCTHKAGRRIWGGVVQLAKEGWLQARIAACPSVLAVVFFEPVSVMLTPTFWIEREWVPKTQS